MPDNLEVVGLEFDTREFERQLRRAERRLDDLEEAVDRSGAAAKRAETSFLSTAKAVVGLVAAYGGFRVIRDTGRFVFDTNVEFQQLEARLVSITGSTTEAAQAFDMITEFARTTPFEVQNLVQAFTTLQAAGIRPTSEMLRGVGNFAAAMGRDITDAVEAILRASQGGTERLRESFFIPISKQGDELVINFRGVEQRVDADARSLIEHFQMIGETQFADGMERQMGILAGALSNLQDSAQIVAKEMGEESGLNAELLTTIQLMDETVQSSEDLAINLGAKLAEGIRVGRMSLQGLATILDKVRLSADEAEGAAGIARHSVLSGLPAIPGVEPPARPLSPAELARRAEAASELTRSLFGEMLGLGEPGEGNDEEGPSALEQQRQAEKKAEEAAAAKARRRQLALKLHREALAEFNQTREDAARATERHEQAVESVTNALEQERLRLQRGEEAALRFSLAVQGITGAEQDAIVEKWRMVEALEAQQAAAEQAAREAFAEYEAELAELKNAADRAAESIVDAFTEMGDEAFNLRDRIGRAVDGILEELARLAIRKAITEPLANAFAGALGGGGIPDAPPPIVPSPPEIIPVTLGKPSGVTVNLQQNLTIQAIDTQTGAEFIRRQKGEILSQVAEGLSESTALQQMLGRR